MGQGKTFWVIEKCGEEWFQELDQVVSKFHLHLIPATLPAKRVLCTSPPACEILFRGMKLAFVFAVFWLLTRNFLTTPLLAESSHLSILLLLGICLLLGKVVLNELLAPRKQVVATGRLRSIPSREQREVHLYFEPALAGDSRGFFPVEEPILLRRISW